MLDPPKNTTRHIAAIDLEALVLANRRFKTAHTALAATQARIDAGEEIDEADGSALFSDFLAAAVHLFTTSNTLVKVANANEERSALYIPGAP